MYNHNNNIIAVIMLFVLQFIEISLRTFEARFI